MMMKSFDQSVEINYNPNRSYILDHPYRILINGGLGLGKDELNIIVRVIKPNKK